jgi:hypothetical protein
MDPVAPLPYQSVNALLDELTPEAIESLAAAAQPGSAVTLLQLRHIGGALARSLPDAGARATLPGEICVFALGVVADADAVRRVPEALDELAVALEPHRVGFYPNFVEHPADPSVFFDGETWGRLRRAKATYDPTDLFRGNHHVPPAPGTAGE